MAGQVASSSTTGRSGGPKYAYGAGLVAAAGLLIVYGLQSVNVTLLGEFTDIAAPGRATLILGLMTQFQVVGPEANHDR